jgi:archaellum biogenesis ATPase FlaH
MTHATEIETPDNPILGQQSATKKDQSTHTRSIDDIASIFTFANREIEYVVDGIIAAGSVCAMTGGSGDGKTTVAIAMASSIERGVPFAGMATQRRPVLILDRENPLPVVIERHERLCICDSENYRIWGGWCPEESPDATSQLVAEWALNTRPRPVIFIDSFVAFLGADENDSAVVRAHMQGYRRLADAGVTVVVLHHSGKGENTKDYRGSSDFKASLDVGYVVTNIGPDPARLEDIRLRAFKSRVSVVSELVLRFRSGQFVAEGSSDPMQTNIGISQRVLMENPRITAAEFEKLANAKGVQYSRARNFLKSGIAEGTIGLETGPHNTRYHVWLGVVGGDE